MQTACTSSSPTAASACAAGFFRATPAEVLAALKRTEAREHLLGYTEFPEAEE
ncbi:hypothetical protein [Actinomycetospora sp. NBC_00405]|uniref:hypothetical protein n=1 Tax=Actinomycetospora sp. NBC_00405 TaxID=2975952 RepID=UPI002E1A439D